MGCGMNKNYKELMVMDLEELIGKTISYASFDLFFEKLMIRFSDGTACIFQARRDVEDMVSIDFLQNYDIEDFREVGIMNEKEYEEEYKARRKSNAELKEIADKKLYEELKKKFKE